MIMPMDLIPFLAIIPTCILLQSDTSQYSAHQGHTGIYGCGCAPSKIVMGIAFYGKGWQMESGDNNGLYRKTSKPARGGGFTYLKDSVVDKNGYKQYWDTAAMAPYLFNPETNVLYLL